MMRRVHCAILAALSCTGTIRAEPEPPPQVQTVALGDAHVQSHLPVALAASPDVQRKLIDSFAALAVGTESAPPGEPVTGASLELVWRPGTRDERVLPLTSGPVLLPVTPHKTDSYVYFVRLRDAKGRFEGRIPASPGLFRVEAEVAGGPTVLDGTGDGNAAQGEMIPIEVRIADPAQIGEVILFHRSADSSGWTSAPMAVQAGTNRDATWATRVQRPMGRETELHYYVQASGRDGRVTHYGAPDRPHRLKIVAPMLPTDADQ